MHIADRFHLHQNLLEAIRGALSGNVPATVKIPVNTENYDNKNEDETVKKFRLMLMNIFKLVSYLLRKSSCMRKYIN